MSCKFCGVDARHPCESDKEASRCANNPDPGLYLNFDASEVAAWIRSRASNSYHENELLKAADLIENNL